MWKNRNVWIILTGEFVAGLGLWLGIIGNLEFMQEKVPSDFVKALILAGGLLAGVAIGPLAGRLTDQGSKKKIMLISSIVRALSVLFMFVAIETGSVLWMVVFLVFLQGSAAFYFPALQAAIPLIVKERELLALNGVHMNVSTLSRVIGTAIAGILLTLISLRDVYALSLVAYLLLAVATWFLKIDETVVPSAKKVDKSSGGFKDVFPIIKSIPVIFMTLVMTLIPLLFIGGFNLLVINISELQDSTAIKGWIYTAEGIAFMAGAFLIKRIGEKFSVFSILFTFSFLIGVAQLMLYFADIPAVSIAAFVLFGFSVGCFFPTAVTIFQTRMPKDYHGRFFSFRNMLDRIVFQVVLLVTGFFLDLIGLQLMVVLFGISSILMTGAFLVYTRKHKLHIETDEAERLSS
ncbi:MULTISPECIES: MFS transporter [Exiguobacterium]|jgi:MFS family permease|uniref:MFS transporter n=1 Tax=Exiguobacterium TaxID=33986 RepID=UPI001BEC4A47|nr:MULTISPECIES: MFS transporter [Exiguobacterium]MCT4777549.1 MFS transporter [Exiguobacterium aquaticum]MCT4788740.1 MFS transporter [Exiguobacterium mexicanum]